MGEQTREGVYTLSICLPLVEVRTTFLRKLRIESWTPFVIFWYTKSENMGIIVESLVILFGTRNQR